MRQLIFTAFLSVMALFNCSAQHQSNMKKEIKALVVAIEKAAADRNIHQLDQFLHKDYRVVANRFKGSKSTTIISKEAYLQMMEAGKIGGTNYEIHFNTIKISGHTAIADLLFVSKTSSNMHKYLVFIQDENDEWKVIGDLPIVMD